MRALVSYDRYTELLSKRIQRTATPAELEDIAHFQAAQPTTCPKCNDRVHSFAMPQLATNWNLTKVRNSVGFLPCRQMHLVASLTHAQRKGFAAQVAGCNTPQ